MKSIYELTDGLKHTGIHPDERRQAIRSRVGAKRETESGWFTWFDIEIWQLCMPLMVNRRVTQQDIARELGLDKSTVSLALRSHPGIALATREKVKAMADKLGYRPDPALSTLAKQRWAGHETGSGAALSYLIDSRMENYESHRRFLPMAKARAEERGYLLHEFNLAEYSSMEAVARVLNHRGIRGLLVPQFAHTKGPGILELPTTNFTIMCLDQGWVKVPFHIVTPDMFETTRRVWMEAYQRGYRRIGAAMLAHSPLAVDDSVRFGSSVAVQHELLPKSQHIPVLTSETNDREAFVRWFEKYRPEVVVGFIERVYVWLLSMGLKVPQDVAFASLIVGNDQMAVHSGTINHTASIGVAGVDALIAAMNANEWGVPALQRKLSIEPVWNEGITLPPQAVRNRPR